MERGCAAPGTATLGDHASKDSSDVICSPADLSATQLNLCAVLGGLGRHDQALDYAEAAARQLLADFPELQSQGLRAFTAQSPVNGGGDVGGIPAPLLEEVEAAAAAAAALRWMGPATAATLATALYNQAVEMEHLKLLKETLQAYCSAAAVAMHALGRGSSLALTCIKSMQVRDVLQVYCSIFLACT